ncbi:hypothetical protein UNSW3_13 [Campylobacter concisus UNSW3]|uniref:Lipoprotein n=1 Tax=Campylobacter concisus UNSW3 TaxID=1242966 RepID=U2EVW0_9BACT|nr:hypothetical protein UNSW3_13 [Campylobacter concisus UNSW3]
MIVGKSPITFAVSLLLFFGCEIFLKYGKFVGITHEKIDTFETFFNKHGEISTLNSRLISKIRSISACQLGLPR